MKNNHSSAPFVSVAKHLKDSTNLAQSQLVYKALFKRPMTRLEVSKVTDIERANVCRYVGKLRKSNRIAVVRVGICPISKYSKVEFLTTNPDLYPKNNQLNLFEAVNIK